jgi:cystathionine beta-lyase
MRAMPELTTQLIHHPYRPPAGFDAITAPVHKASTVIFPSVAALRARDWTHESGYTYGLAGTPTSFMLEERIATLEGGRYCALAPSGLAALTLVDMAFLSAGDEVLIPDNAYGPKKAFAQHELAHWGIACKFYDPMDPADLAGLLTPQTRLVWLEAAGSITLEYPDLPALVAAVKAYGQPHPRGIVTALDNTWGAGIAFCAFDMGVDVSAHALTKYPSGGADVLMGSVVTRDRSLHHQVLQCHGRLGLGVAANDVELMLRGLPSTQVRYAAQDATTRALAHWLHGQRYFQQVLHPALPDSPGHAFWQRDCTGAACLITLAFKPAYSQEQVDRFCDSLQLFKIGHSWAGPMSLCATYQASSIRSRPSPYQGPLVRLSIGLESAQDLQADLEQALAQI